MKLKIFITIVIALVITGWRAYDKHDLKKAEWLIGTWESKTPRGSLFENWKKISDNEFAGKSYILKNGDTTIFESIRIVEEEKQLFYIPIVKDQNGGQPVRFKLKQLTDSQMIFENLQHDFPQQISYSRIGTDSLLAQISGTKNGKDRKQGFPMRRLR